MDIVKKPYEISLWEDVLTFVYADGTESEEKIIDNHGAVVAQYYKERQLCIIGSDSMNTPIRATQGKLVSKVNGENILTFNMYSHYYDTQQEEYLTNPYIGLLVNERKLKLRHGAVGAEDTKWYDLIIKEVQENSEKKIFTYTAKDQYINELSKTGYELTFDVVNSDIGQLSNNQKYKENIGKVDIYYRQDVGNPKVIFKIDKNDNCSIEVIGVDSNFQNINKTYEFQFTRVEKELSDNIGIELEIPYTSKDTIRKSDNSIGIYGSENNKESTSIRMNIYQK